MNKRKQVNFVPTKYGNKLLSLKDDRLAFDQQDRGEVRRAGNSSSVEELAGVAEIGLTHKDIHEARSMTDPLIV